MNIKELIFGGGVKAAGSGGAYRDSIQAWLPIKNVIGGVVITRDNRFIKILEVLPEGPAFYPKDTLTDKSLRFFASEIVREKILRFYDKEIPYCCEIEIESYKEEPAIDRIAATIHVARESQKGILIGHKGEKLKRVGEAARKDMEQFLGKKVFLQLFVKVSADWRDNERQLRRFGYEQE